MHARALFILHSEPRPTLLTGNMYTVWMGLTSMKMKVLVVQLCLTLSVEFSGKNTGEGCPSLLQEIFLTRGLNPTVLRCRQILHTEAPVRLPPAIRSSVGLHDCFQFFPFLYPLPSSAPSREVCPSTHLILGWPKCFHQ